MPLRYRSGWRKGGVQICKKMQKRVVYLTFCLLGMAFIFSPRCYAYTKTNSDPWHHSRVALSCEPADAGYVYAKQGENQDIMSQCVAPRNTYTGVFGRTWNNANFPCLWTICTKSANDDLYTFDYWECTLCEGDIINYSGRTSATVLLVRYRDICQRQFVLYLRLRFPYCWKLRHIRFVLLDNYR